MDDAEVAKQAGNTISCPVCLLPGYEHRSECNSFAGQNSEAHKLARSRRMLTVKDVDTIGSLVRQRPHGEYQMVIDLGAGSGTTALAALCARREAVADRELRMRVLSFDVDQSALDWTQQAVKNAGFERNWRGFQVAAQDGARHWEDARRDEVFERGVAVGHQWVGVDILLHDAGHGRGEVYPDVAAWLPKLVPWAFVWVHDYSAPPADWGVGEYTGVKIAVDRLVEDGLLVAGSGALAKVARVGASGMGWAGMKPEESDDGS